jgi:hypothetical protein
MRLLTIFAIAIERFPWLGPLHRELNQRIRTRFRAAAVSLEGGMTAGFHARLFPATSAAAAVPE